MIASETLEFETLIGDIVDITEGVSLKLAGSGINSGIVTIFVPGSTGALTTIEHESGLIKDFEEALERLAPQDMEYAHDQRWGDGNGYSHVRASIIGPSLTVPFAKGKLMLGTWQQIVFLEMDCRPRKRRIILQIIGDP